MKKFLEDLWYTYQAEKDTEQSAEKLQTLDKLIGSEAKLR